MNELIELKEYDVREFPARSMFLNQFFQIMKTRQALGQMPLEERDYLINQTGAYIFNICKCVAITAVEHPDVVLSFALYVDTPRGPVFYFAYTKSDVRNSGFMNQILRKLDVDVREQIMVCYSGHIPVFMRDRIIKKRIVL